MNFANVDFMVEFQNLSKFYRKIDKFVEIPIE